jgi:FHA domain
VTSSRRQRRETAEAPIGIGGLPPFPCRGPITAFRVLGRGFEVTFDASRTELRIGRDGPPVADVQLPLPSISSVHALLARRFEGLEITDLRSKNGIAQRAPFLSQTRQAYVRCERLFVHVGDRFALGSVPLLALDDQTHQLVQPLTAYSGAGTHGDVDGALESILRSHMILLHGSRSDDVLELARTLHDHSIRKDFPFTPINAVPAAGAAIEELCAQAGCGTIFLDLTRPFKIPPVFARHLFSDHFHLWTIVVARVAADVIRCFGEAWYEPKRQGFSVCELGFPRQGWHWSVKDVTFTEE